MKYTLICFLVLICYLSKAQVEQDPQPEKEKLFEKFKLEIFKDRSDEIVTNLLVWGRIEEINEPIPQATITIFRDNRKTNTITANELGQFSFEIDYGFLYTMEFSKAGYITKKVEFDLYEMTAEDMELSYEYGPFEVKLFRKVPDFDFSIYNEPMGKIYFDAFSQVFRTDKAYYRKMQRKTLAIEQDVQEVLASLEEENSLEKNRYEILIRDADIEFKAKDYKRAITFYQDALSILPNEKYPSDQILKIEEFIKKANKNSGEQFLLYVQKADSAFSKKEYENAKSGYENALNERTGDYHCTNRLSEIESILATAKNEVKETKSIDISDIEIKTDFEEESKELASKYPQGITTETEKQGNKTITRYIFVKGSKGVEYKQVKHDWGGNYYFRNNETLTRYQFNFELESLKQ